MTNFLAHTRPNRVSSTSGAARRGRLGEPFADRIEAESLNAAVDLGIGNGRRDFGRDESCERSFFAYLADSLGMVEVVARGQERNEGCGSMSLEP